METDRYTRPVENRAPICLYASMPNRGLDAALALWPRGRTRRGTLDHQRLAALGLHQLRVGRSLEPDPRRRRPACGRPPPCARPRSELIEIQQQAALTLYPCRFPEMFCLSAAESAAAGTPVITSPVDALVGRVRHGSTGLLVDGDIDHPGAQAAFADATVNLLKNPTRRETMAVEARAGTARLAPDTVAAA
ncbi:glycosyltransferase [Streptomyces sp. NPDC098085]|uniref:glycosyltransferase n=1 Tax=Streptomyces sp. NPDC098085 TaxID=3366094 RepID=UPI003825A989